MSKLSIFLSLTTLSTMIPPPNLWSRLSTHVKLCGSCQQKFCSPDHSKEEIDDSIMTYTIEVNVPGTKISNCQPSRIRQFLFFKAFKLIIYWPHSFWGFLVPPSGIEPVPPAVVAGSLNHLTTREAPKVVVEPQNCYSPLHWYSAS